MKLININHNHDKYITTPEFDKFTAEVFDARLARTNLMTKTEFDTKLISTNKKINWNKTKHVLVKNEFKKLQTSDSSYCQGKNHFEENGTQEYSYFSQCTNISIRLVTLIKFQNGSLKYCLMKLLNLLLQMIIKLFQY